MSDFKEAVDNSDSLDQEISPGQRLRSARKQSGLTRKEAASHLKLSVEKIDLLERGEVDQLAAPVFVAGYLRAYAKLVGLPEEEIIAGFKALSKMEAPSMDPSTSPAANNFGQMEKTSARRGIKARERDWSQAAIWGSVSIVLAVILFMAFTGDEVDTANKVAKKSGKTEAVNIPAVEDRGVNEKSEGSEEKEGSETLVTEPDLVEEPEEMPIQEPLVEPEKIANTIVAKKDPTTANASQKVNKEDLNHSVIVFNFKKDSWIEVNDALDKRLLYRLGKAGSSRTVWGVAPFNIQLGFVQGVDIIFNGEPYDLSRFANRKSARFKLGESGDRMKTN